MTGIEIHRLDLTKLPTSSLIDLLGAIPADQTEARNAIFLEVEDHRGVGICITHSRELVTRGLCDRCLAEERLVADIRAASGEYYAGTAITKIEALIGAHRQEYPR